MAPGRSSDGPDFFNGVHRSVFCGLRYRDDARLRMVLVADALNAIFNLVGIDLAIFSWNGKDLATRKVFGGRRFVYVDMCKLGTDDGVKRARDCGQRGHVRTRSVVDKEGFHIGTKQRFESLSSALRVRIRSIGGSVTLVRAGQSFQDRRMYSGVVVAREGALTHTIVGGFR